MKRLGIIIFFSFFFSANLSAQDAAFWYDYKLKQMTLDEKIGQLFMVSAYSNKEAAHTAEIDNLILKYHIGGLIFFQNDPLKQAYLTNYYQQYSSIPLMIGIDGEWGLAMRLQNTQKFPYALTLGAMQSDSLTYQIGVAMGKQFKRMGIHINFGPDVDINNNPKNPIIGFRSFGSNKYKVAQMGIAYSNGMLSENVLSCAKHFPGHGDVSIDSHLDLPVVNKTLAQLDTTELYPFKQLIKEGVSSIMVAHMSYPQLDSRPNRPTSLSKFVIDTLLKQRMKFEGLIFTDALNMKGVAKFYTPGYVDLEAFIAGNDMLLCSENVPVAFDLIKQNILSGTISIEELDRRVLKILKVKQTAGLNEYKPIDLNNLETDLKGIENYVLFQEVANLTVSIATDNKKILPLKNAENTAAVAIGDNIPETWSSKLKANGVNTIYPAMKNSAAKTHQILLAKLRSVKTVIISLHQPKVWSQSSAGYTANDFALINKIAAKHKVILVGFCNPYALQTANKLASVVVAYEDLEYYHKAAANIIFGKLLPTGKVPVELKFDGPMYYLPTKEKFKPNKDGIDTTILKNIDDIAQKVIQNKAAPGCRILVLKNGVPYYDKCFGHLNYDKQQAVKKTTLYDIASITKIASTTISIMKLHDEGKLPLEKKLSFFLPETIGTNKGNLVIKDILMHQAGLTAWIPFYKATLLKRDSFYKSLPDSLHSVQVAKNLYILKAQKDSIYQQILKSPLESKTYRYSDLSMMLMQKVVETISGKSLNEYVSSTFYNPMGLKNIGYQPLQNGKPLINIAPTQYDLLFRKQLVQGFVHDPGAAMLGGVSGHAGIFSDVYDLATIMQMLLNNGYNNNKHYLNHTTIKEFTKYNSKNSRRGYGFDKPDFSGKTSPASTLGSEQMFGHTGFTGTCAWADPEFNLVFIFLSNRTCPDDENKELINGSYRIKIQDIVYKALGM